MVKSVFSKLSTFKWLFSQQFCLLRNLCALQRILGEVLGCNLSSLVGCWPEVPVTPRMNSESAPWTAVLGEDWWWWTSSVFFSEASPLLLIFSLRNPLISFLGAVGTWRGHAIGERQGLGMPSHQRVVSVHVSVLDVKRRTSTSPSLTCLPSLHWYIWFQENWVGGTGQ